MKMRFPFHENSYIWALNALRRPNRLFPRVIVLTLTAALLCIPARSTLAVPINSVKALKVAERFILYHDVSHTIRETEPVKRAGRTVGYLMRLSPRGYILVAADTIRVPIKAYSFTTSDFDGLPPAYIQVLRNELCVQEASESSPSSETRDSDVSPEKTNRSYWEFLTRSRDTFGTSMKTYTPGTALLATEWKQSYPYNKFTPTVGDERTVTGCTQTAVAQVMRYHAHPASGTGVFHHTWNGQELTAVMNRPFNWDIMPETVSGSVSEYQQDEVAALMRDLGVMNEADFGTEGTSTYFHSDRFERAFGYAPVLTKSIDRADFFPVIMAEIDDGRPMLLSLPGHMAVADGYADDGTGRNIHVNFGWGGAYDDYYYLDQTIVAGNYTYEPDHTIYYNIRPCQGTECNPYDPEPSSDPPVMASELPDLVIDEPFTLRIDACDPDGDAVTLSAVSSCGGIVPSLDGNLLSLTPGENEILCEITVAAQSLDGIAQKKFRVLSLDDQFYIGTQYDIGGTFADGTVIDEYRAYLEGTVSISGDRGYSNQAFYVWVRDDESSVVIPASDTLVSEELQAGFYTICASLTNPFTHYAYTFDPNYSGYILSVTTPELTASVTDVANSMGIQLTTTTRDVIVLTSDTTIISSGESVRVYGTVGDDNIILESGARAELINFPGNNRIAIVSDSGGFAVSRSGAYVSFEGNDGTLLKMPATLSPQTIVFDDGSLLLYIDSGEVLLGGQVITAASALIDL